MDLFSVLNFVYAILGIGIIIFIHELGHFLAAKKVGVRVEKFYLGFDPVIRGRRLCLYRFKRGETEYGIGALLFGGYVKMAGETVLDRNAGSPPPRSHELLGKPPGARAMVFAAGAIFNIVSACIFFIIAFRIGVSFFAPVVGDAAPGKPAWEAGIRPGDRIVEIDGNEIVDFNEIALASVLGSPDVPRTLTVERDGKLLPQMRVKPVWSADKGFHVIGVAPAYDLEIQAVKEGSAAGIAGVRKGDRIVEAFLDGFRIPGELFGGSLAEFLSLHPGKPFDVVLQRKDEGGTVRVTIQPERKADAEPVPKLGVKPAWTVVKAIQPGSGASAHLFPGDRVLRAGGKPIFSMDWITVRDAVGLEGPAVLEVASVPGDIRTVTIEAADLIRWTLWKEIGWASFDCRIAKIAETSPFAGLLRPGDAIVALGKDPVPVFRPEDLAGRLATAGGEATLWVRRENGTTAVPWKGQAGAPGGIEWDSAPPADVLSGSPAARAGIPSGSRIVEIGARRIDSWENLQEAVREADPKAAEIRWVPPGADAAERKATVDLLSGRTAESYEDIGFALAPLQHRVQAGIVRSCVLGAKRTIVVAQDVFMTLKGLLSRQVKAKNLSGPVGIVNIIYRVSEYGLGTLIYWLALISVNLGLFNLLPFPILDGGHLLFLGIEKVKGSPVDVRIQEIVTTIAVFAIIGLALFVTYHDLVRLIQP